MAKIRRERDAPLNLRLNRGLGIYLGLGELIWMTGRGGLSPTTWGWKPTEVHLHSSSFVNRLYTGTVTRVISLRSIGQWSTLQSQHVVNPTDALHGVSTARGLTGSRTNLGQCSECRCKRRNGAVRQTWIEGGQKVVHRVLYVYQILTNGPAVNWICNKLNIHTSIASL